MVSTYLKFYAAKHKNMQQNTILVETIILKVKDYLCISESHLKLGLICCTKELFDNHLCNLVQGHRSLQPRILEAHHDLLLRHRCGRPKSNNATRMYYLYFMYVLRAGATMHHHLRQGRVAEP
ncbi:Flavin-containing monooxygenase [Arachis hypogaea]|nr:Flavin-containing monooxygenase [Arachis hypogaea]